MTTRERQDVLTGWLEATLEAVESGVTVAKRIRKGAQYTASERLQKKLFGKPVFYLEVTNGGNTAEVQGRGFEGAWAQDFGVVLLYEYEDHHTYERSSQRTFDEMTYGTGGIVDGLLDALRSTVSHDGKSVTVLAVQDQRPEVVPVNAENDTLAHLLEMTVRVQG